MEPYFKDPPRRREVLPLGDREQRRKYLASLYDEDQNQFNWYLDYSKKHPELWYIFFNTFIIDRLIIKFKSNY